MSELKEDAAIAGVLDRLATRFPTVPHDHIAMIVTEERARLSDAPVRDFVPVLVERAALERLRVEAGAPRPVDHADEVFDPRRSDESPDPMEVDRKTQQTGLLYGDLGGGPD